MVTYSESVSTEIEPKTYELAYHLNPDLEEAEIKRQMQELSDLITRVGGSVLNFKMPQRIHLSYAIKNKGYSNFGLMDFTAPVETAEKISEQMKPQTNVLRYLVTKKPEEGKELRILGQYRSRPRIRTHETVTLEAAEKPAKEKTEAEKAQLEKEVEKVIEGL